MKKILKPKEIKGITLIVLVITVVILLILSGIIIMTITQNGLLKNAQKAKSETIKNQATEAINLKITSIEIDGYAENQKLPSLQYLSDKLCEDNDMEYVLKKSKKSAALEKINVSDVSSIYTKLKKYPYEFEINSALQLASIDGVEVSKENSNSTIKFSADLEEWIETLGDDVTITIEDVTNNNLIRKLMENKKSVEYMFSHNNIFEAVLNSSSAMEELGKSKYAGDMAIANENYREKVLNSKYVDYFDKSAITIPKLSNNTNVIYSSIYDEPYHAFDQNKNIGWLSKDTTSPEYIGYNFGYNVIPYKVEIINYKYNSYYRCKDFYIQGSLDNNKFENLTPIFTAQPNDTRQQFKISNVKECESIKMVINNKYTTSEKSNGILELQVYCRSAASN